jgi:radical SAM superfamily enzyme YgiQ (UPF0313 family)
MKILLVWPKFPETFWGFKYALPFIDKKTSLPPLGLLTVAALLPKEWEKKIIDVNVEKLTDNDLEWADFVFISAMVIQKGSVGEIIKKVKKIGKKIVAGGPLFTTGYEDFLDDIDYFVLGEAETTLISFCEDLKNGCLKKIYKSKDWPDIRKTPAPLWNLIDMEKYASMSIQYSRGCPFNCEFCDIVLLNGRIPRTKDKDQVLRELDALYNLGWRGNVFFVDDNFIGNKQKLKEEILPAIIKWVTDRKYPFAFSTQVSINLADDKELMELMVKAGFDSVFVGIETIEKESLTECGKFQNLNRDLLASVESIQSQGLQVQAGFILGFDSDTPSIFERITDFIQKSGIVTAMVGLLQAPPKTRLYERLKRENRLISEATGNNTDCTINFVPKMNYQTLIAGYKKVLSKIYSPRYYYQRLITSLKRYKTKRVKLFSFQSRSFFALLKSIWILGIKEKERVYYWKLVFWSLFRKPKLFPLAIELAIWGFHFRKVSENYLSS